MVVGLNPNHNLLELESLFAQFHFFPLRQFTVRFVE